MDHCPKNRANVSLSLSEIGWNLMRDNAENITLTPDEQLSFWRALQETVSLTEAQKRLAAIMQSQRELGKRR